MGLFDWLAPALGVENNYNVGEPYQQSALEQAYGNYAGVNNAQGMLAQSLVAQSQGQGPSPTQTMLQQAQAQQAAAAHGMAQGNRGVNQGLAMRQALMAESQGAQNLAGQASIARQQEQLSAQNQLRGLYGDMGGQAIQQQQVINSANLGANQINSGVASGNQATNAGIIGGLINAGGKAATMGGSGAAAGKAHGGVILPPHLEMIHKLYHGGQVTTMVSPGEKYLDPQEAKKVATKQVSPMSVGEKIPGKAPVKGDSAKNDIVAKDLDVGGVVIPKSVMESKNPEKEAAAFVAKHIAESRGSKDHQSDFKEALQRAIKGRKKK